MPGVGMGRTPSYGSVEPLDDELASETEALLEGDGSFIRNSVTREAMPGRHKLAVGLSVVSLLLGAALVAVERLDSNRRLATGQGTMRLRSSVLGGVMNAASGISLEYEVENNYGKHTYLDSMYPWLNGVKLVEPYKTHTFRVLEVDERVGDYVWEVFYDDLRVGIYSGSEIQVVLPGVGKYYMYLRAVDDDKATLHSSKEVVYCKYVKREIRVLTAEDRTTFFDAAQTLWKTTTEAGQRLYGPDYMDIMYFTSYHLTYAAERSCDHMHDGVGFMTQHAALTMKFEKALQAVDPSVTLPYWDFTIDAQEILLNHHEQYSKFWFEGEMFSDDIFGRVDPQLHTVTSGRWAYLEIPKSNVTLKNAYGLMRSPWNTNKNKYLTRYSTFCGTEWVDDSPTFPTCETHYNSVAGYNTWEDFAWEVLYSPHGPIHAIMGGVFGCEKTFASLKDLGLSDKFLYWFSIWSFGSARKFYRFGFYDCPETCSDETPQEECMCQCSNLETKLSTPGEVETLIKTAVDKDPYQAEVLALGSDAQIEFVKLVCNANLLLGDHIEAASPYDPSFWPIHPTIERLWQYKKLKGLFTDETWPTTGLSTYQDTCTGHAADSTIPLEGLFEPETYMTNAELYAKMDPMSDGMPYVFVDFEWAHCKDFGIDFDDVELGVTIGDGSGSDDDAAEAVAMATDSATTSADGQMAPIEGDTTDATSQAASETGAQETSQAQKTKRAAVLQLPVGRA